MYPWLRLSPRAFRGLALAALVALSLIVVTGGAVRLTGSGLGCPDWPTCARSSYVAAFSFHPMVEFVNRMITVAVTVLVVATMLGTLIRSPRRRDLVWLALGLVGGVLAQIVLGGLTVLFKLAPPLVMAHFLVSMAVVWDAVVLFHRSGQPAGAGRPKVAPHVVHLGRLLAVTLAVVLAAGTAVTGSGPHSGNTGAKRLAFPFSAAAELHSTIVLFLIGLTVATLVAIHHAGVPADIQRRGRVVLEVMVAQGALGYIQYFLRVPAGLVELHLTLATALWIAAVWFNLGLFHRDRAPDQAAAAPATAVQAAAPAAAGPTAGQDRASVGQAAAARGRVVALEHSGPLDG